MTLTQNWVGYLDRSFEQIKQSCIVQLGLTTPEISDYNESNPLIIILSMFSGIGEMLNLYIDSMAKEAFIGTLRRYSSAVKLVKLIDYNIHAMNPSTASITFGLYDNSGNPIVNSGGSIVIPSGSTLTAPVSGVAFILDNDVTIANGSQYAVGTATQFTAVTHSILGNTDGSSNQIIQISSNYVDGSMSILINGVVWTPFKSFGLMSELTTGFIVSIDENKNAFIEFGDGVNGAIPLSSQIVYGTYAECSGSAGNLPPSSITQLANTPTLPSGFNLKVNNADYSSGGTDFENLQDIQNRAPRSIRTLERAVTYQDYIDLAESVLGVGAAEVGYCCGKFVNIFIAPNSAGTATLGLLQNVMDYMKPKVMITTQISVQPSGISLIWINATVYGKPGYTSTQIYSDTVNTFDNNYGFSTLKINRTVSITDIITLIDSQLSVDHIDISQVKISPFPRPNGTTTNPLNIQFVTLPTTAVNIMYRVSWRSGSSKFDLFRNTFLLGEYAIGDTYIEDAFSFKFLAGTYTDGDTWTFTAYKSYPEIFPLTQIPITDYSAPIIQVGPIVDPVTPRTLFGNLTIVTTNNQVTPLPDGNCM